MKKKKKKHFVIGTKDQKLCFPYVPIVFLSRPFEIVSPIDWRKRKPRFSILGIVLWYLFTNGILTMALLPVNGIIVVIKVSHRTQLFGVVTSHWGHAFVENRGKLVFDEDYFHETHTLRNFVCFLLPESFSAIS